MMLIDTNVFIYVVGRDHANKAGSTALLDSIAARRVSACTDAEVLQEILHRFGGAERRAARETAYGLIRTAMEDVIPIDVAVADAARDLMARFPPLSARDAVHLGVCRAHHIDVICSYDRDLDVARAVVRRIEPERLG